MKKALLLSIVLGATLVGCSKSSDEAASTSTPPETAGGTASAPKKPGGGPQGLGGIQGTDAAANADARFGSKSK